MIWHDVFDCTADLVGQLNGNAQKGMLQIDAPPVEIFWLRHCVVGLQGYGKLREVWTRGFWDTRADRRTDRQTDGSQYFVHFYYTQSLSIQIDFDCLFFVRFHDCQLVLSICMFFVYFTLCTTAILAAPNSVACTFIACFSINTQYFSGNEVK